MAIHLHREMQKLKKGVLALGALVEQSLRQAVEAFEKRDHALAASVIERDGEIDEAEVDLEEECLKILALHQPVAIDLRFVIAVLKINNDLERIGDLAVNVAERASYLATHEEIEIPAQFKPMSTQVQGMVRHSLDALVNMDTDQARRVCDADDQIDKINREVFISGQEAIRKNPDRLEAFLHVISTSRNLERIADHATNIAEDVIYMIEGEIVRHSMYAKKAK